MFERSWLGKVASGHYRTELTSFELCNATDRYEGRGYLDWTRDKGLSIKAISNGASQLMRHFQSRLTGETQPGSLYPDSYYLSLSGKSSKFESVKIDRIFPEGYNLTAGQDEVVWEIDSDAIGSPLELEESGYTQRALSYSELLFTPCVSQFVKGSELKLENPHFGYTSSSIDWLEFDSKIGKVAAIKLDNNQVRARILHRLDEENPNFNGLGLALSFLEGRTVNLMAQETFVGGNCRRKLYHRVDAKEGNLFHHPLGRDLRNRPFVEPLLARATDFFSTEIGTGAGDILYMCLESTSATFTIHALVVCVALESLIKLLVRENPGHRTIDDAEIGEIKSVLTQRGTSESIVARISTFLGKIDEKSPKNTLHLWSKENIFGVTIEDIKAWDRLRNAAAHGKLLWTGDHTNKQKVISSLDAVKLHFRKTP